MNTIVFYTESGPLVTLHCVLDSEVKTRLAEALGITPEDIDLRRQDTVTSLRSIYLGEYLIGHVYPM